MIAAKQRKNEMLRELCERIELQQEAANLIKESRR